MIWSKSRSLPLSSSPLRGTVSPAPVRTHPCPLPRGLLHRDPLLLRTIGNRRPSQRSLTLLLLPNPRCPDTGDASPELTLLLAPGPPPGTGCPHPPHPAFWLCPLGPATTQGSGGRRGARQGSQQPLLEEEPLVPPGGWERPWGAAQASLPPSTLWPPCFQQTQAQTRRICSSPASPQPRPPFPLSGWDPRLSGAASGQAGCSLRPPTPPRPPPLTGDVLQLPFSGMSPHVPGWTVWGIPGPADSRRGTRAQADPGTSGRSEPRPTSDSRAPGDYHTSRTF